MRRSTVGAVYEGVNKLAKASRGTLPSFEEGAQRPIRQCNATLNRAQRGRSGNLSQQWFDLPGRAEFKVAIHYLIGAAAPPRRRGKCLRVISPEFIHTVYDRAHFADSEKNARSQTAPTARFIIAMVLVLAFLAGCSA